MRKVKYVKRRQRSIAVLLASLVLLVGAAGYIGSHLASTTTRDYKGDGNGQVELITVADGQTLSELGPILKERGIIANESVFQTATFNNPAASNFKPGVYKLEHEMSVKSALDALLNPDNKVQPLTINGGDTLLDVNVVAGDVRFGIYSKISEVTCSGGTENCITVEELQKEASSADLQTLGVPSWAMEPVTRRGNDPKRLEGLIAPGEYIVDPRMSAKDVLKDLITKSAKTFADTNIEARAQAIDLSPYELLTAASLVEREAPGDAFDKVARVILNRLHKPMKLEFDSTVNYDLPTVEVATTDEDRKRQTPWNTYAKEGLPETPIAAASLKAIAAMENPAEGNWLFFVAVDKTGKTVFTDTYDQHLDAVEQSQRNGVLDSNR
ncbi:MAG: endolytic transglycosylase MltG [Corynebacterium sp.]|nr:endolytic transglycosylase MltG [Corynebacterium sp.]